MSKPVRVSLFAPAFRKDDYTKIRDRVKAGEDTGADILLGYDHFFPRRLPATTRTTGRSSPTRSRICRISSR